MLEIINRTNPNINTEMIRFIKRQKLKKHLRKIYVVLAVLLIVLVYLLSAKNVNFKSESNVSKAKNVTTTIKPFKENVSKESETGIIDVRKSGRIQIVE